MSYCKLVIYLILYLNIRIMLHTNEAIVNISPQKMYKEEQYMVFYDWKAFWISVCDKMARILID